MTDSILHLQPGDSRPSDRPMSSFLFDAENEVENERHHAGRMDGCHRNARDVFPAAVPLTT